MGKTGRNDPCPCGSGKKYKKCCLARSRKKRWTLKEIRSFPTEEIITKLGGFGINVTAESFPKEAENFFSACDLAENWWKTKQVTAEGFDQDFPWMAAIVLWERLSPHIISSEKLDDMMQEGYRLSGEGKEAEACNLWLDVWEHLKKRFTPEMKSIREAERVFSGLQSLSEWCQDLELELGNAGIEEPVFYEERIKFCREFCSLFPETSKMDLLNMKQAEAESYRALGLIERGEKAYQALVEEFPDSAWAYIDWGDMYKDLGDYDQAESIYRMALERNVTDQEDILERLRDLGEERESARKE